MSLDSASYPAAHVERALQPARQPRRAALTLVRGEVQLVVNGRASGAGGSDEVVARATSALRDAGARVHALVTTGRRGARRCRPRGGGSPRGPGRRRRHGPRARESRRSRPAAGGAAARGPRQQHRASARHPGRLARRGRAGRARARGGRRRARGRHTRPAVVRGGGRERWVPCRRAPPLHRRELRRSHRRRQGARRRAGRLPPASRRASSRWRTGVRRPCRAGLPLEPAPVRLWLRGQPPRRSRRRAGSKPSSSRRRRDAASCDCCQRHATERTSTAKA